jgi:hypothetical protein
MTLWRKTGGMVKTQQIKHIKYIKICRYRGMNIQKKRKVTPINELPEYVKGEIYLAMNKITKKPYIGQTRTHILSHGRFNKWGSHKRWRQHVCEAIGNYKHQSIKLNNAIRKYGGDAFEVTILITCPIECLNDLEKSYITQYDSVKNGYNLTFGGNKEFITEEGREKIANTLIKYYEDIKLKKFEGKKIISVRLSLSKQTDVDIIKLYATIDGSSKRITTDFGGKKCKLEDSAQRAKEFALKLIQKEKIIIQSNLQSLIIFN